MLCASQYAGFHGCTGGQRLVVFCPQEVHMYAMTSWPCAPRHGPCLSCYHELIYYRQFISGLDKKILCPTILAYIIYFQSKCATFNFTFNIMDNDFFITVQTWWPLIPLPGAVLGIFALNHEIAECTFPSATQLEKQVKCGKERFSSYLRGMVVPFQCSFIQLQSCRCWSLPPSTTKNTGSHLMEVCPVPYPPQQAGLLWKKF